jgi:hypothetical protein
MKEYTVTSTQLDNMKHALGFDNKHVTGIKHRKYAAYRNYFTTADNESSWDNLVEQGLAIKRPFPHGCGDNPQAYSVSEEGLMFLSKTMEIKITEDD